MRIPLVGPYNTRPPALVPVTTASGVIGVGVIGVMVIGGTTRANIKDRRFINCFVQTARDELTKTATPYVVKRQGFGVSNTPAAGSVGSAIHVWVGQGSGTKVISAFGATNSTIYDSTSSLGAITGKATAITETSISGTANLAISSTDSTGWYYPDGGSLTKITDGDFPGNAGITLAGTFAHLGGYAAIMGTDGYVYTSDINSLTAWTAGNKFATNSYPDKGIGCIRRGDSIIAFGTQSFEVLRNAGVPPPGSPLMRVPDSTQAIGAVSALAIINVRDGIYFAGSTAQGSVSIFRYNGGQAVPVSPACIDSQLLLAGASNITLTACTIYGSTHIVVRASSITYCYCVEEDGWWELQSLNTIWDRMDGVSIGTSIVNYAISTSYTGGKVYILNPSSATYQDDSSPFTAQVQTAASDFGTTKRKTGVQLTVIADQETSTSALTVDWTDDDYASFNDDIRSVDLSKDDLRIFRLGTFRKRAFRVSHSANTQCRLQALDIEVQEAAA